MATSQVEGCKGARAAEERSRLYTLAPLSARSLPLPPFCSFGLIITVPFFFFNKGCKRLLPLVISRTNDLLKHFGCALASGIF
jgi:hypothetical protein